MCGIVGAIAKRDVADILVAGLKRLEYRGYDSAGMATWDTHLARIECERVMGKVEKLESALSNRPLLGHLGIAHTRWATHGEPSEINAHPHCSQDEIAIVHNGIIENHAPLKKRLTQLGYKFQSDTDTEVIVHLLHHHLKTTEDPIKAIRLMSNELEGAYALGILIHRFPNTLFTIRHGSPLVIGIGIGEHFLASDPLALLPVTQRFVYLEEGDIATMTTDSVNILDIDDQPANRQVHESEMDDSTASKGHYRHFMQKEIFEQPMAISQTLEGYLHHDYLSADTFGHHAPDILSKVEHITIVACGTSYHAGLIAKNWFHQLSKIPCQVEIASEIRYRPGIVQKNTLFIAISQSGETADTLAALRAAKSNGYLSTLAICNAPESSLARESDLVFITRAGVEIGVAATKTFTTQLVALLMLAIVLGKHHNKDTDSLESACNALKQLPTLTKQLLELDSMISTMSHDFLDKHHALFLGRGEHYPVALEGALKLKEISYLHAEAYPAGELKHGPLALVDNMMPVIVLAPNNDLLDKVLSNLHEVSARGGIIYAIGNPEMISDQPGLEIIPMPNLPEILSPIFYSIPLQLLAYHIAVLKGTDVDQPRNLAKSVTVE